MLCCFTIPPPPYPVPPNNQGCIFCIDDILQVGATLLLCPPLLRPSYIEHHGKIPPNLLKVSISRAKRKKAFWNCRGHFADSIGLSPKTKGHIVGSIPTIYLPSKKNGYPPRGFNIYETDAARKVWEIFQEDTPYPDCRGGRT